MLHHTHAPHATVIAHGATVSVYRARLCALPRYAELQRATDHAAVTLARANAAHGMRHDTTATRGRYLARRAIAAHRAALSRLYAARRAVAALRPVSTYQYAGN